MRPTGTSALAVAAVSVALVATVLASRGDPGDRTAAAFETAAVGRTAFLSILGLAFLLCALLALWALWPDGSGRAKAPPPFRWLPYLVVAALLVVLASTAPDRPRGAGSERPAASPAVGTERADEEGAQDRFARASATASLTLAAVALAALLAWTVVRRRGRAGDDVGDGGDGERSAAGRGGVPTDALAPDLALDVGAGDLSGAIAAIEAEADPRRAVLLAYAVLDALLRGTPAARPRSATPHEWLARIHRFHGDDVEAVEAARRLTDLYERARFAVTPMRRDDRASAADAVAALRTLAPRRVRP